MKRIFLVLLVLAVVAAAGGLWIWAGGIAGGTKHYCETDSDCVLSWKDPDGFHTCVNRNWNEEWEKNPESKEFAWACLGTGEEKCGCINNKCQRTDSGSGC
jgi:hypothetical protein